MTLRRCPGLAGIEPSVDLHAGTLTLRCAGAERDLVLPLPHDSAAPAASAPNAVAVGVCSRKVPGECSEGASAWMSRALGARCRLVQHAGGGGGAGAPAFANEAQLLLVDATALVDLQASAGMEGSPAEFAARFRPNVVVVAAVPPAEGTPGPAADVEGDPAALWGEEQWGEVEVGGAVFVSAGPCPRCEMICVDPATGRCARRPRAAVAARAPLEPRTAMLHGRQTV